MALLASGSREMAERLDMELYMRQAEEYRDFMDDSNWNKMLQYYALMSQNHPLPVGAGAGDQRMVLFPGLQKHYGFQI